MYKKLLLGLLVVAGISLAGCATRGGVIDEMVGWWKFDESAGEVEERRCVRS